MDAAPWARNHPDAAAVSPGGEPPPSAGRPGAALPRGPHGVPPVPRTAPSAALKPDASSAAAAGPHRAIHCPARRCPARDAGLRRLAGGAPPAAAIPPRRQAPAMSQQQMWTRRAVLAAAGPGLGAFYRPVGARHHQGYGHHHAHGLMGDRGEESDAGDGPSGGLIRLVEDHRWIASLNRITTNPEETTRIGIQGRTPLHIACDHGAPPALVKAILRAWPEGAERVGTNLMNPLHIACSITNASVEVVQILLEGCRDPRRVTSAKDLDGDTPLHAACRCGATKEVLVALLQANPRVIAARDYEGLNPLFRLWVRYFVSVGERRINAIRTADDVTDVLVEAWTKSLLLLRSLHFVETRRRRLWPSSPPAAPRLPGLPDDAAGFPGGAPGRPFLAVHAAALVDCPRAVVRMAAALRPRDLLERDGDGDMPVHVAARAPVHRGHDLRVRGDSAKGEDADVDEDLAVRLRRDEVRAARRRPHGEPSVLDVLLGAEPRAAAERDGTGRYPLHSAAASGKRLDEGVGALLTAYPEAVSVPDGRTALYPFMLAASAGGERGGDASTIYRLLRASPGVCHMALDAPPPPLAPCGVPKRKRSRIER